MANDSHEDACITELVKAIAQACTPNEADSISLQPNYNINDGNEHIIAMNTPVTLYLIAHDGHGNVYLVWDRPTGCGPVSNYLIERRQIQPDGEFGHWEVADNAYLNEIELIEQPLGTKLEYRVKAVTTNGETLTSNHISV
jgi:hypothetical protein